VHAATATGTVLVVPAAAGAAPPPHLPPDEHTGVRTATLRLTCLAGLAGAPAVALPLARVDGLPLGITLVGAPGTDLDLLDAAVAALAS
jgi:Asp-tRNA(Asn)/Glu-tRNA(Gln) amidotransferase A subunit family amidase